MGTVERLASSLIGVAFRFERFFPQLIGFFIGRKLGEYKKRGWITDYRVKSRRMGRYHYFFELDLFLEPKGGERDDGGEEGPHKDDHGMGA